MTVLAWLVVGLCAVSAGLVLLLVVLRVSADLRERRRAHAHAVTRELVLTVLMGEPDEVLKARDELARLTGEEGRQAEAQIFSYLPKVSGETRTLLVELVLERDAADRARDLLHSWSSVRRCRGAYRLGALHRTDAVPLLIPMLRDRTFLVRRVALRALGSIGDPTAVVPILRSCGGDDRLTRDVVSALERIGQPGAAAMRNELAKGMARSSGSGRHAELATVGLGLIGDVGSVDLLVQALGTPRAALQAAAAEALGRIGAPSAIPALVSALGGSDELVRASAAGALGDIGDPAAAEGLGQALDTAPRLTSRSLAAALLRLGEPGLDTLRRHPSPYAAEALAVHGLRGVM
ncbi:HEAT repeat domain-containing protein [Nocardioides guangzhouensis]|uniref:HEAT repeat domain-containing protein n=1 Tax=Nocardioides guangzhouensis TaxID=2497878 RepID=A0A4Q4ZG66_9ACTN|nr:HEAT repeat domain-containing protein [Nocardioides guangzhouensis]RYP86426.1 HEAT repeat domain-containing protein [Nocardioides guangzhouensis]